MSPPPPKRPPRSPRPPEDTASRSEPEGELPFDEDEVAPLQADDPRPQRVPQYPAGSRRRSRRGPPGGAREGKDREMPARFTSGEYEDTGYVTAFLYVERGPGAGQLLPIKQGTLVLGRASTSDLRLQHPSISRRHAQLTRRGDHITLKDLGSQNGTYVNRNRVTSELELLAGDEVSLGNALLRIRGPGFVPERVPAEEAPVRASPLAGAGPRHLVWKVSVLIGSVLGVLIALLSARHMQSRSRPSVTRSEAPRVAEPVPTAAPAPTAAPTAAPAPGAEPAKATGPEPEIETPVTRAPDDAEPRGAAQTPGLSAQAIAGVPRPPASKTKPARTRPATASPSRAAAEEPQRVPDSEAEAEALAQYEAGQLDTALTLARKAHLDALGARISHFKDEWRAGNNALAERDFASASQHLTLASQLDQQLSGGWSSFAPKLREALQRAQAGGGAR